MHMYMHVRSHSQLHSPRSPMSSSSELEVLVLAKSWLATVDGGGPKFKSAKSIKISLPPPPPLEAEAVAFVSVPPEADEVVVLDPDAPAVVLVVEVVVVVVVAVHRVSSTVSIHSTCSVNSN